MTKKKAPEDLQDVGRPTAYKPEFAEQARKFCLLGATDIQLAGFFDVCEKTVNTWKQKYPEFLQSIKRGKALADADVAEALFKRAVGHSHSEERIFQYQGKPVVVPTTKHYPPDTKAASLWLRNRQPDKWRDAKDVTIREPEVKPRTTQEILEAIEKRDEKIALLQAQL